MKLHIFIILKLKTMKEKTNKTHRIVIKLIIYYFLYDSRMLLSLGKEKEQK